MSDREYTLIGILGSGGFGTVYLARMRAPGGFVRDVAIKLLHERHLEPDTLSRFRDEARILGLLHDRAVVTVEPPTRLAGRWALVMDYVEGRSCLDLLRQHGTLPPLVALEIVEEVARCLDKAYHLRGPDGKELNVLHRDIKPANLQITPSGEVRLLDFGVARAEFDAREARSSWSLVTGTPGYIAPERMKGLEGPAGDVYSLGMVLWNLLTGRKPTERTAVRGSKATGALALAEKMLAMDPDDRPTAREAEQAARELGRELEGIGLRAWAKGIEPIELDQDELVGTVLSEGEPDVPSVTPVLSEPAPAPRRRWMLWIGVVGGAAGLGTVLALGTVAVTGGAVGAWLALGPVGATATTDDPVAVVVHDTDLPSELVDQATVPVPTPVAVVPVAGATPPTPPSPEPGPVDVAVEPTPAPAPEVEPVEPSPAAVPAPAEPTADTEDPDAVDPKLTAAALVGFDKRLTHPNPSRRMVGLDAIRENPAATQAIIHVFRHDPVLEVREEGFYMLVYQVERGIGAAPQQADALTDVLLDKAPFSQRKAVHAYGMVGTDFAPIAHLLKRGSPTARNEAIRAAVEIAERTDRRGEAKAMLEGASSRVTSKTQLRTLEEALAELSE